MSASPSVRLGSRATITEDIAEFAALLYATTRALVRLGPPPEALREAAQRGSLGQRHFPALAAVAAEGPISVSELAVRLGLLLSTTSTIVGQLSRAGFVERREDQRDRRRTLVQLHPDYQDTVQTWFAAAMAPVRDTLEALSPEARGHFMQAWRTLHERATTARSPVPNGADDCAARPRRQPAACAGAARGSSGGPPMLSPQRPV